VEQSDHPYASQALGKLLPHEGFLRTRTDLKNIVWLYRLRAGRAAEKGSPLHGWPELVAGLEREFTAEPEGKACIYLQPEKLGLILFTNATDTKLLGILVGSFDQRTPAAENLPMREQGN